MLSTALVRWTLVAALATLSCNARPDAQPDGPELIAAAGDSDVALLVKQQLTRAGKAHDLLVYVGAPWCEPCRRFHDAVARGELKQSLPRLRLLEFNLDQDRERLAAAGYSSKLIPLFALPALDGRSSGRQIEGSVKGEAAVSQIVPRLQELVGSPRAASR